MSTTNPFRRPPPAPVVPLGWRQRFAGSAWREASPWLQLAVLVVSLGLLGDLALRILGSPAHGSVAGTAMAFGSFLATVGCLREFLRPLEPEDLARTVEADYLRLRAVRRFFLVPVVVGLAAVCAWSALAAPFYALRLLIVTVALAAGFHVLTSPSVRVLPR